MSLLLAALLLLCAGCGPEEPRPPEEPGESITVTDDLGRTVTVRKQPEQLP